MESRKKKKGQNQKRSSPDGGRRGVKFVTVGDEIGNEENGKQGKAKIGNEENGKQGKAKIGEEENGKQRKAMIGNEENSKQGKAKGVRKEGRKNSVSPLRSTSSQKDKQHVPDKAQSLSPAPSRGFSEASKAFDATKPSKKSQCQTDPTKIAKLAPVAKTIGLLRSPAKVTTAAKSDGSRQRPRRTSLTSTKKPKIKIKRSKTEDDNAEEDHQEEKRKQEKRILDIRLPEIIIDVAKDNVEELENSSAAMLVQNLQTANIISDKQVSLDKSALRRKGSFLWLLKVLKRRKSLESSEDTSSQNLKVKNLKKIS